MERTIFYVQLPGATNKWLCRKVNEIDDWVTTRNDATAYSTFEEARAISATCGMPSARVDSRVVDDPRHYGMGDPTKMVRGVPRIVGQSDFPTPCPICGCRTLYDVEVDIEMALLISGRGTGKYIGCAACPFASPMMMVAAGETPRR